MQEHDPLGHLVHAWLENPGVAGSNFPVAQLVVSVRLLILRSAVRARPGKLLCPRAAHQQKKSQKHQQKNRKK